MGIVVQKFGGTSVETIERIRHVAERVKATHDDGHQCVVVVSAMGKSTDQLIDMARQLSSHPPKREMDMLLTTGEQVSISLLTMALREMGVPTRSMTGWQAGIETDDVFGQARITSIQTDAMRKHLNDGEVLVVAGFQGWTPRREITTLGRGGSDTTAVALAAALDADYCEIYTDVTGVYTADPRIAPLARKLDEISFDEMLELANLGAGILHPRAVECAKNYNVQLVVRSSFTDEPGTRVKGGCGMEQQWKVRGLAHDLDVARIKVLGLPNRSTSLSELFGVLAAAHINVDIIVQSEHAAESMDVSFSVEENETEKAVQVLEQAQQKLKFADIMTESGLAKVSAVGAGMVTHPGVAADMFSTLAEAGIPIKMVSTSEIKISCVIPLKNAQEAVRRLHTVFELDTPNDRREDVDQREVAEGRA